MKSKKGFTLVELLGIIAIIATVLAFVVPSVIGMLKRDDEKEYQRFLTDISLATESYIQFNIGNYPDLAITGGSYTISMQDLIENGYIKSNMINPKTDRKISISDTIQVVRKADGSYDYSYVAH
ncbi:MAG: type II secretion system protein [Bacilli bacterium]|nr:type II secretion system protein [Bacilli bacterium]